MKKKHEKLLQDITNEVPKEWRANIMKKVEKYGFIKDMMEKAIADPDFPEAKKNYYTNLLKSGQMDVEQEEVDEEIQAKIDGFIDKRILEEVEKKNLPKYAFKHLFKKTKKIIRKIHDKNREITSND